MYRVYLRTHDGQVVDGSKTITTNRAVAAAAFAALLERRDLDGQRIAATVTHQSRGLAFHRFDREPGSREYWRDRLDEIEWPELGGQREGAGRPVRDGAQTERFTVKLDPQTHAHASELGGGDVSLGLREMSRRLRGEAPQSWSI